MCGLVALLGTPGSTFAVETLRPALKQMHLRGPDAEGVWQEPGVCLGHRRLAIQDLDVRSNQPMHSACGRYVIVFNGEIYNFHALRSELMANCVQFHTTSDTEVLLALFALEGAAMLPRLRGMFAFVIWDRTTRRGFAARDPYGIKPLYWAQTADGVLLASQVQALLATGLVSRTPCARGQAGFWLLGSVPEPHTWYQDIQAQPAGHCAWIDDGRMGTPECWWDVAAAWRDAPAALPTAAEVRERTRAALHAGVAAHLVADVPVGVFLSGGIDSGALAGLMVEAGVKNLQGITVAFHEYADTHDDEAPFAARLAEHYGITHHVRHVSQGEFAADLPRILAAMDQPSVDGINTWYAAKAVAELGLKVVVSGVGGDELFQRYGSFKQLPRLVSAWAPASRVPGAMPLATTYLRNQLLRDSDWASMDHSVELRTPLVDAWLLRDLQPLLGAFSQFPNKRLLAEAPVKPLPEDLITRRKTGFGIPVQTWLKQLGNVSEGVGPSQSWARELVRRYENGGS